MCTTEFHRRPSSALNTLLKYLIVFVTWSFLVQQIGASFSFSITSNKTLYFFCIDTEIETFHLLVGFHCSFDFSEENFQNQKKKSFV